jgi:hypothetical protein
MDVGLRNASAEGIIPGPRMLVSVHAISATGGHCDDQNGMRAGIFGPENGIERASSTARRKDAEPFATTSSTAPT